MTPVRDPLRVAVFSGGRGSASLIRHLIRSDDMSVTLLVNGYDDGLSTGALRRLLPGMLGPSDFRKALVHHLDPGRPADAALRAVVEYRFPVDATRAHLAAVAAALSSGAAEPDPRFADLAPAQRCGIDRELGTFLDHLDRGGLHFEIGDCSLGNLVFAGAYLRVGRDFNAAVDHCRRLVGSPIRILDVTTGVDAHLVAVLRDGTLLPDEASIVGPHEPSPIAELHLLADPLLPAEIDAIRAADPAGRQRMLDDRRARIQLDPEAHRALTEADAIVYGPGTQHSSLLPSYLTPGLPDAVAGNPAPKIMVVNVGSDHDIRGLGATDLVDHALRYLGDPLNRRGVISHVLCDAELAAGAPSPAELAARGRWAGARWITADVRDPARPGHHSGAATAAALRALLPAVPLQETA